MGHGGSSEVTGRRGHAWHGIAPAAQVRVCGRSTRGVVIVRPRRSERRPVRRSRSRSERAAEVREQRTEIRTHEAGRGAAKSPPATCKFEPDLIVVGSRPRTAGGRFFASL